MPFNTIDQGVSYIRPGRSIDPIGRLFDPGTLERRTLGSRPFVDRERKLYPDDLRGYLLVLNGPWLCYLSPVIGGSQYLQGYRPWTFPHIPSVSWPWRSNTIIDHGIIQPQPRSRNPPPMIREFVPQNLSVLDPRLPW